MCACLTASERACVGPLLEMLTNFLGFFWQKVRKFVFRRRRRRRRRRRETNPAASDDGVLELEGDKM